MIPQYECTKVQEIAANMFPARILYYLNGWILRINDGFTTRANSCLPLRYDGSNLEKDIDQVEFAYRKVGLPPTFMLFDGYQPPKLKEVLLKRGYALKKETLIFGQALNNIPNIQYNDHISYTHSNTMNEDWKKSLLQLDTDRTVAELEGLSAILSRIIIPTPQFFIASQANQIVGIVMAVFDQGYVLIMDLTIDSKYRRQRIAHGLLHAVIEWSRSINADKIFLQVEAKNTPAIALYKKFSFQSWGGYVYIFLKS